MDSKNLVVNLTFDIAKKNKIFFEKIQVAGNTKTRDKVVRRELWVAEGELYNVTGLNKSRDRLKRLGFFKEVEFTTSRGSTDEKINLDIKVEEAPTGAVSFGVGYGSMEGAVASASVSDRNLFGLGYSAALRFRLGRRRRMEGLVLRTLTFLDPDTVRGRTSITKGANSILILIRSPEEIYGLEGS